MMKLLPVIITLIISICLCVNGLRGNRNRKKDRGMFEETTEVNVQISHGSKKINRPITIGKLNKMETARSKADTLSRIFRNTIQRIRHKNKRLDVVFLIDASSSVGQVNFLSEIKFVKKMLSDFNVSFNHTRVAIVTFSSHVNVIRHIDQISTAREENDKCKLLNYEIPKITYSGGGTYTYGALKEAKNIFAKARKHSRKLICLITDGFSNGKNPIPIAHSLKNENIAIVTFGIQMGNHAELYNISSDPFKEHSFLLDSFAQFESMARKALHSDYKFDNVVELKDSSLCDVLCDKSEMNSTTKSNSCCDINAVCTCGTTSGHYACICNPGYYGPGLVNQCLLCPNGTYWQGANFCKPCPDVNHITIDQLALNITACVCKTGLKSREDNTCEVITCPQLEPPANGYFVKHPTGCGHVLNAACGSRCISGYQLVGSSIRLCQENGTWSGNEANCVLKTCPNLSIPYYGMVTCKNADLNLFFDYTPRNETFMVDYDKDEARITEPMPIDTDCNFKCGPGFYLVGSGMRNCLPLSKWDGLQTTCKQILCPPLPKVPFGEYNPIDCTEQKIAYDFNCTIICRPGFEAKGVSVKSCTGKRTGTWTNRNKQPRCVDVTPPNLICPGNFSVRISEDSNMALITYFPPPNVTDNSEQNVTFWLKPSVKTAEVKLPLGDHTFTYVAVDSFKNKAKCNFTISVIDITPPVFESCQSPPEFVVPFCTEHNMRQECLAEWEDPIVYDNSGIEVYMNQSIYPGLLDFGTHFVIYDAYDSFGNHETCIINVKVKQLICDILPSPLNGQTLCAKNLTHTWCEIVCDIGYAIFDESVVNHLETVNLYCENNKPKWKYETVPDCTPVELPTAIQNVISITLDSETPVCGDTTIKEEVQNEIYENIRQKLCSEMDNCEIVSHIPDCLEEKPEDYYNNKTFYNIAKRDLTSNNNRKHKSKSKSNIRVKFLTRIGKRLGLWNRNSTKSENMKKIKYELRNLYFSEQFKEKLDILNINIKQFSWHDIIFCRNGSVPRLHVCVQCPRGSFHNITSNNCQLCPLDTYNNMIGQIKCINCPLHYSTRKSGCQSVFECKEQCGPGTVARLKPRKTRTNQTAQKSLMPFCRKCNPGEYQPYYNQLTCGKCLPDYISPRGSASPNDCTPKFTIPCLVSRGICGPNGVCVPESKNPNLYNCICEDGYIGAHCEHRFDLCLSAPCYNQGTCYHVNTTTVACKCTESFRGEFCEIQTEGCTEGFCRNRGICVETHGKPYCECMPGYEGQFCENQLDFCAQSPCETGKCLNTAEGYYCQCPPGIIGRRCHLKPCDYLPCSKNAICTNLEVYPATRNSYTCQCLKGLKGRDCTEIDNPCASNPCRNHGNCIPGALRDANNKRVTNEDLYEQYRCECLQYFYGENCDILTTPDFVLEFSNSGVNDYVQLDGPVVSLQEITLCAWMQSSDAFNYGTVISYATKSSDNMFTLTDYNGFVLYVNGSNTITDITLNDGLWHFLCVAWTNDRGFYEIYVDGVLQHSGFDLSTGQLIEANGTLIIGQEQDNLGSSFSESESFIGKISYLDIWSRFLEAYEIQEYYSSCEPYHGDLYAWSDFKRKIKGDVQVLSSPFCQPCPKNISVSNGHVLYEGNQAIYHCHEGYKILGPSTRECLRTSQWSLPLPYCRTVRCGQLPTITNGEISLAKSVFGEEATFTCYDGFHLVGSRSRICMLNGTWSGTPSKCISNVQCDRITSPENAMVIYMNERGQNITATDKLTVGIFAEIQCVNDTVLEGEGFLTCTESAMWDYDIPKCIKETSENIDQDRSTTDNYQMDTKSTSSSDSLEEFKLLTNNRLADNFSNTLDINALQLPDQIFWKNLRRFYYSGCNSNITLKSEFCAIASNDIEYTDLSAYESQDSGEFYDQDIKLLTLLNNAVQTMEHFKDILTFENIFQFILYGFKNVESISMSEENLLRLVFCFHIDTILLDSNFPTEIQSKSEVNIVDKIKLQMLQLVSVAYNNYNSYLTDTGSSNIGINNTTMFERNINDLLKVNCDLLLLPMLPPNSIITNIYDGNKRLTADVDKIRHKSMSVPVNTKVFYSCGKGYSLKGISFSVCQNDGTWTETHFSCDFSTCKLPSNPINIEFMDKRDVFQFGHRLQLTCKIGYKLYGNQFIVCLPSGKWSKILSRCAKISCNRPNIPADATIVKGQSYLYEDTLEIECDDYTKVEIECQSNGNWYPQNVCRK